MRPRFIDEIQDIDINKGFQIGLLLIKSSPLSMGTALPVFGSKPIAIVPPVKIMVILISAI